MANDPEHPMNDQLRRYAKQRLDQANPKSGMHPATRRLLQDEIKRHYKTGAASVEDTESTSKGFFGLLKLSWPRMAVALGVFLVLGGWMYSVLDQESNTPEFTTAQKTETPAEQNQDTQPLHKEQDALRMEQMSPADIKPEPTPPARGVGAPLPPATPPPRSIATEPAKTLKNVTPQPKSLPLKKPDLRPSTSGAPASTPALSQDTPTRRSIPQIAGDSHEAGGVRSLAPAQDPLRIQNATFLRVTSAPVVTSRPQEIPSASPAQRARAFTGPQPLAEPSNANRAASAYSSLSAASPLQEFRLHSTNGLLQIRDRDGSIYEGILWDAPTNEIPQWRFRVRGTNRTLQQPMEFRGAIRSDVSTNHSERFATESQRQPIHGLRSIEGTYFLEEEPGTTREWRIQAREGTTPTTTDPKR